MKLESFFTVAGAAGNDAVFVMELCDGGSLLDALNARAPRPFAEADLLAIFLDVCQGVAFMHAQKPPIAHRDIKIENVLRRGRAWKLCDFGSATTSAGVARDERTRQLMADDIERNTTMAYRAPEMCDLFRKQLVCERADVWALGCLLYKAAFFCDAFEDGTLQILNNRWSVPKTSPYSPRLHDLIRFMLEPDPARRPHIGLVCARTAQLLNRPNPVPVCDVAFCSIASSPLCTDTSTSVMDEQNFVPYNHAAEVSGSPSAPQGAAPARSDSAPKTAAPPHSNTPAAAGKGDFFSMLAWVDDSNTPAPAPAPAASPAAPAQTPKSTSTTTTPTPTTTPQAPSFFDTVAASPAPSQSPHQEEDIFAAFAVSQSQPQPQQGQANRPRRASGGGATLSPPPTRPAAVHAPEPQVQAAQPVAGCTSFFDNDFAPPAAAASATLTPPPAAARGSFWDNDFCVATPTPPPAAGDAFFSMQQAPLVPTIMPPPQSPRRAHPPHLPQAPHRPASTTVTAEPTCATTCKDHILSVWKK